MDDESNHRWKLLAFLKHLNSLAFAHFASTIIYRVILDKLEASGARVTDEEREEREIVMRSIRTARDKLISDLINSTKCRDIIRMDHRAFFVLCQKLQIEGGLKPSQRLIVEEQVARFLYILGHNTKHRVMSFFFYRGKGTISRDFHRVMRAILQLEATLLKQPDGSTIPLEISRNHKFYPYFKDCVGSIDGTHIRVKVPAKQAPSHRGRKDFPTTNVLAACTPNLKFTYVIAGWEGTISDSRMLKDALKRRYPLKIPPEKFYLVDAGFMIKSALITPYRGERYHLKEYSRNPPQNHRELFNLRHASLRNSIERAFGILKKRFPIIASGTEPHYKRETQKLIILACCILHNFLLDVDPDNEILAQVDRELANARSVTPQAPTDSDDDPYDTILGEMIRDRIATEMWNDYIRS